MDDFFSFSTCTLTRSHKFKLRVVCSFNQMFNLFALLCMDNPLKPVTLLTNGAIDETLQQFASLSELPASAGWLS